ncbi:Acetolactate synthase [BD1-7 clade bacterium]|uniref:Acetolactate synthase n=1 Tax=BD1-7 clade bacterium TaxID=2029982 RepID=A0A5S9PU20_9GAMM|nr:Acetolactate synthase [BD1-7 clade bacterium]
MKASDLLVKCLEEEKIEYIFGVPGEENADFMMSLEQSDSIQFILTRHEQGAAFMAEAYGRLTGHTAGCLGTLGPGATNLITGVADSNMDRAPMLVLTGQGSTNRLHKESHQIMNVVKMFEPVTKWSAQILNADTIPEIVRKSVRIARTEKPGAVMIELPEDIAEHDTQEQPMTPIRYRRSVADPELVKEAADLIKSAKRPLILAGNGCVRKRSSEQLTQFCEKTGIGVLNTFMAKGCVDFEKPYSLFTIGLGAKDIVTCAIDASDLIISIGFDMVEYHPHLWNPDGKKRILHLDFTPSEIDKHYHPELELIGDIAKTMAELNTHFDDHDDYGFDLSQQASTRENMYQELMAYADDTAMGKVKPQKVLHDVREVMGREDILLSDVGAHKMWIARHYQCHEPNTCLISNGFCSMGFALPGAIGADFVYPDRKILAICGDAGFMMNVQEMETAKRYNSNIVAMVWEDHEYGLIAWKQWAHFGKHTQLDFGNPDWRLLAESFGWNSFIVENSDDVKRSLQAAFDADGPSLVVVPIDYAENKKLTERLGELTCVI